MSEQQQKILDKLNDILETVKLGVEAQKEMLDLFKQYDIDELINDEELRNIQQG